jgi:hypothetical protein
VAASEKKRDDDKQEEEGSEVCERRHRHWGSEGEDDDVDE